MAGRKNGLGRGLDAFFPDRTSVVKEPARKTITKTVKTEKKSDVAEKQTNPTVAKKQTADSKTGAMIVKISMAHSPEISFIFSQNSSCQIMTLLHKMKEWFFCNFQYLHRTGSLTKKCIWLFAYNTLI